MFSIFYGLKDAARWKMKDLLIQRGRSCLEATQWGKAQPRPRWATDPKAPGSLGPATNQAGLGWAPQSVKHFTHSKDTVLPFSTKAVVTVLNYSRPFSETKCGHLLQSAAHLLALR